MSLSPVKASQYDVLVEYRLIDTNEEDWKQSWEIESAYTAADAITQVELRFKYNDRYEKAMVIDVRPRNR